jgi:hypothetical protein
VCGDPASSESFWSSLHACFSVKHAHSIDSGGAILRQQPTSFAAILAEHSPPSLDALPLLSDPSAARLPALGTALVLSWAPALLNLILSLSLPPGPQWHAPTARAGT